VKQIGRRPIDAALVYARRGWPVFPCHNPTTHGCSCHHSDCSSPAKHPRVAGGLKVATIDEDQIHPWWARWPTANVAIRTGAPSGIVVVDIDPDHGGLDTLAEIVNRHGPLPDGRTITTGSGGQHRYFAHPGGVVRNDVGRRLGAGIDIRGDGGYVIAPPSRHRSGCVYNVTAGGTLLPEVPGWLAAALVPPKRSQQTRSADLDIVRRDAWTRAALNGELERLEHAPQGARNDTLNRVAYRLGQIVGAGLLPEQDAESILIDRAIAIGLGNREAAATTRSGLTAGRANPGGPRAGDGDGASIY
jgi:hypothetical protein